MSFETARAWRRTALAVAMGAALVVAACGSDDDDDGNAEAALSATIRYTSYGVPHVKADSFKGAGYGYGYAFAKDNVCVFAEELVTLRGERSKFFGEDGGYLGQLGDSWQNVASDFFYKLLFTPDYAATVKAASSKDSQDLTAGFVAGYNRYLREVGASGLPAECKDQPWVTPMTEAEAYLRFMQAAMAGSSMAFINAIGGAHPPGAVFPTGAISPLAKVAKTSPKKNAPMTLASLQNSSVVKSLKVLQEHTIGSNGVALGKDLTESGAGIVLGNPHFPWWGTLRLNQVHLTIPSANYDVYGATLLGVPLPLIGFNDKVAWTHTFSTDNRFTLRVLTLDPSDPTRYVKDGISKPLTAVPLTITAKAADGTLRELSRTLYRSEFGPMLMDASFTWTAGNAFAIQDANYTNYKLIDQVILNGKATDVDTLQTAGATYTALPWVNTMAADKNGKVLYANYSVAANVADAQLLGGCVPGAPYPFLDLMNSNGVVVMTGSTSACDWGGHLGFNSKPSITRSDYILNANDSHWWPTRDAFLAGYPKIIATGPDAEGKPQGERTRLGHAMVRDRAAGADGLDGNKFSVAKLQQLYLQGRFLRAEKWLPEFVTACLASGASAAAKDACTVLQGWDLHHAPASSGAVLFKEFYERMGELAAAKWWAVPFDATDPLETPRGMANSAEALTILEALVLDTQFDSPLKRRVAPANVQVLFREGAPLPIPGGRYTFNNWRGQKTLDPTGSGMTIYTADPATNAGAYGNSYIQFVTWDANGPVAEGVLTYGQSAHASSVHFNDLTKKYAAGQFVALPYTEAQITADPNYQVVKISE